MSTNDIVERLRLEASDLTLEAATAIERLHERLCAAEARLAAVFGTLEMKRDEALPFSIKHDVAPSTPR